MTTRLESEKLREQIYTLHDFYPSTDEKSLEGPVKSVTSHVSRILSGLNDPSKDHDLSERGKLAGQESKFSDPE